ncbi:hypothetical protein MMC19_004282 [Ptychographa xylographoides]|nr:hypothetical protein [Ptychographa xylographoides]
MSGPLSPYVYRPATPPSTEIPGLIPSGHSRNTSDNSSIASFNSSPESADFHVRTPYSRSPVYQLGPTLLPKIRTQDQSFEPLLQGSKHRRVVSQPQVPPPHSSSARPVAYRSTTSPPEYISLISPVSATSVYSNYASSISPGVNSAIASPITLTPSFQRRLNLGHSRSSSAGSIDDATLGRYGYPYRGQPSYVTGGYYSPSVIPGSSIYMPPSPVLRASHLPYELPEELQFDAPDEATLTLNEYLRQPNPQPSIVRQVNKVLGSGVHSNFWWDVRNLRAWDDFNLENILEIPSFPDFLSLPVNASAFPNTHVAGSRLHPESEVQLAEVVRDHYMVKVNAASKITINAFRYVAMRVGKERDGPHFVSNYQDDAEMTLSGNGRGRVVGLVKSYERWNTGMRAEAPHKKVVYLKGLAHLHGCMREHQCRYGWIMTETELVCVRAMTDDNDTPYYGALELSPAIEIRTQEGLTATLALWYLHMLAKNDPLPGQSGWRLNVQAPAAMTRTHVMDEKDEWIPTPQQGEKRDAKRTRGWALPGDPWNRRKEGGKAWNK